MTIRINKVQSAAHFLVIYKEVNWKIRNNVSQEQVIKKLIIHVNCFTRKEHIPKLLPERCSNEPYWVLWHFIYRVERPLLPAPPRGQHVR